MGSVNATPKVDYPPLLPGGVHQMTLEELMGVAVTPFNGNTRRQRLYDNFCAWIGALTGVRLKARVWCCGSFMTSKPTPTDIDSVLWTHPSPFVSRTELTHLLAPHAVMMSFGIDLHVEPFHQDLTFFREAYHLGFHGFANDRRTPRGIAEIILE